MRKLLFVIAIGVLLSISTPLLPFATSSATSVPSCNTNSTLHITMIGGVPSNFNSLLPYNSGFAAAYGAFKVVSPLVLANGMLANDATLDTVTHNSNYTVWVFHILPNQTWSNGQPVTAQDIVNTYSTSFASNPSYNPTGISPVKVYANSTDTAVMILNQSQAHLPRLLVPPFDTVVYPQSFTSNGPNYTGFGTIIPSDGPFYIYNYTSGSSTLIMYRNPYYNPQPKACEIIWNFVEGTSSTPTDLIAGSTDVAPIDWSSAASIASHSSLKIVENQGVYSELLMYNYMAYPMNTTAFRQALAFAINDTEVRDVAFSGFGIPGNTGAGDVPNSSVFYNPSQTTYEYDTAKAISLLGTMGITKGADGFLHYANGTDVTLTIWADNSLTSNTISAQIVQTDLQDLGFKVSSQILDAGVIRQYAKTDQFGAFAGNAILLHTSNAQVVGSTYAQAIPWWDWNGFVPQPANNTEVLPLSDNSAYWSNYSAFAATANQTADNQYLSNIQAIRARDLPMIPLVYAPALFAVNTAKWSNWPASNLVYPDAEFWNFTALATVTPAVASSSSSTSAVASSSSSTSAVASSSSSTSAVAYPTIATAMVAVVVIVAGTVFGLYRRRSGPNG